MLQVHCEKLVARAIHREFVYKRAGEPSVTFHEKGGARQRADVFLQRKTEQSELCSIVVPKTGIEPVRESPPTGF